jgi:Family of unknown function (DUF6084)
MNGPTFDVLGARTEPFAAVPTLVVELQITAPDAQPVHAIALKCQVRIEPQRRHYGLAEEARLLELFGETPRWGDSLRPFLWTHVSTMVNGFVGSTTVALSVTCTYDFEVAASKYLHALEDGCIPLLLCFSGTVFTAPDRTGVGLPSPFSASLVSWDQDLSFPLPVKVWRDTMDLYFPNSGWIRVDRETIDALQRYKAEQALPTWDQTLERLLKLAEVR